MKTTQPNLIAILRALASGLRPNRWINGVCRDFSRILTLGIATIAAHTALLNARCAAAAAEPGKTHATEILFQNTVRIGDDQRTWKHDVWQFASPTSAGSPFHKTNLLAFEEHRLFTQRVADESKPFGAPAGGKSPQLLRRAIFLKPDIIVLDDQVRLNGASGSVRWLLHAHAKPTITGRRVLVDQGDGVLLVESLLPAKAIILRSAGDGGQPPGAQHGVEIAPSGKPADVRFLHLLQTRRTGDEPSPAPVELSGEGDQLELSVTARGRVFHMTLPPPGDAPGEIAVAGVEGESLLARRPLAAGVLPSGPGGTKLLERWDVAYHDGKRPPWETGRPAPELEKAVEDGTLKPCRVVELGCGSGSSAIYLASQGFDVTAIDIAPTALKIAEEKARRAGVNVRWLLADVLAPPNLEPFDLIFDRGCYHNVRRQNSAGFVASLRRLSQPGTRVLILAGNANEPPPRYGPPRVKEEDLRADFSDDFTFEWLREFRFDTFFGSDRKQPLAWSILLRRKDAP